MINDYDWEILDKRLKALEDSLEMLKAVFTVKDSTSDVDYVLYQGDLTDAGLKQQWSGPIPPTTEFIGGKKNG